jgi:hypothetical protein
VSVTTEGQQKRKTAMDSGAAHTSSQETAAPPSLRIDTPTREFLCHILIMSVCVPSSVVAMDTWVVEMGLQKRAKVSPNDPCFHNQKESERAFLFARKIEEHTEGRDGVSVLCFSRRHCYVAHQCVSLVPPPPFPSPLPYKHVHATSRRSILSRPALRYLHRTTGTSIQHYSPSLSFARFP